MSEKELICAPVSGFHSSPIRPAKRRRIRHFQASVLGRRRVDADQGRHEQRRVERPSGLLILVRFKACATRHFEIDLVLEQDRRRAEQRLDSALQATLHQAVEARVNGAEILDPLYQAHAGIIEAGFVVHHMGTGLFRPACEFIRPGGNLHRLRRREESRRRHPALAREPRPLILR